MGTLLGPSIYYTSTCFFWRLLRQCIAEALPGVQAVQSLFKGFRKIRGYHFGGLGFRGPQ